LIQLLEELHQLTSCAAVAVEIEPMFAAEAKERQIRKPIDSVKVNLPKQNKEPQARDQAASVVGVSGKMLTAAR